MGQIIDKLMEPFAHNNESKEADRSTTEMPKANFDAQTPPNVIRLKTDPRSPLLDSNRTPIKVPLDE